jgi:3-oxoacyl-[acyl-carrier-protein] synthase-3
MPHAAITAIDYYLPVGRLTNAQLAVEFPEWGAEKIAEKTGIQARHIAGENECSSDLAEKAAVRLFAAQHIDPATIDYVLFCTQTPDFALPTSACLLQHRLGIPTRAGALDFNLGCSGYIYGLSLGKGLIETGQARCVLFLTGETYSKLLAPTDKTVRTIFGDAGAATLLTAADSAASVKIGPFVLGTNGQGGPNLVCHQGGFRGAKAEAKGRETLWMDGPEIFNFTLQVVPETVRELLARAGLQQEQVDLFVFHQANHYMLDHLRRKLKVPPEKFMVAIAESGNTVSCSIPIALHHAQAEGRLKSGMRVMLVGFGVGYSWGAAMITWP